MTLGKIADPEKRNVNLNVLVIGGSGSGKTRYHIKPNLLQMNASYVCSDPKGTVVEEVGRALVQQGHYKLKILNTIDFGCSMHYNPFHYLHSETDILSLVTVIMENTQSKEGKGGDDFWSKAEALLYQALIAYIYYEAPEEEKNMTTLLDMLNACECREDDENFKSAVDLLFEQLEQRDANHFAVRQYKKFKMAAGKTLGIVGESGSGKSVSAMSILKLLDGNGYIDSGTITFKGRNLAECTINDMYQIRGNEISVIFQEPMTSLNPVYTIEKQLNEVYLTHQKITKKEASEKSLEMLKAVKIPNPESVMKQFPHQLSGGMRQRVMIAMALACEPSLLIADEPTTALDVTIQAQILKLMNELKKEKGTSILFITHDLGVINQMADEVAVMYCGQVVEMCKARTIFAKETTCSHPYTEGLMTSIPRLDTPVGARLEAIPGAVPHPLNLPKGCKFAPRCKYATEKCMNEEPKLELAEDNHLIRCFYPDKEARHAK